MNRHRHINVYVDMQVWNGHCYLLSKSIEFSVGDEGQGQYGLAIMQDGKSMMVVRDAWMDSVRADTSRSGVYFSDEEAPSNEFVTAPGVDADTLLPEIEAARDRQADEDARDRLEYPEGVGVGKKNNECSITEGADPRMAYAQRWDF